MPVWRDAEGVVYENWNQLGLEHLKNVVVLLAKRVEEAQREWKKQKRLNEDQVYTLYFESRWRELLVLLENASRVLRERLGGNDQDKFAWELDSPSKTPLEVLVDAKELLPKRRKDRTVETVSKIVERPRKLRIEL